MQIVERLFSMSYKKVDASPKQKMLGVAILFIQLIFLLLLI